MKYFKNTELAKLYHVSEKSVRNWIEASKKGKVNLLLHEERGKSYVANISRNTTVIEELVQKGKKFKNTRGQKAIVPTKKFYQRYNSKQILDMISNIDIYREIPYQYNYFNGGALHWDLYTQKLLNEKSSNYLTDILEILEIDTTYLDHITEKYSHVNIIDIGPGNCLPVRPLLEHLQSKGKLKRYVCLDTSHDMLSIAERNITKWFAEKVAFEAHVRDINYDRFDDLVAGDSFGEEAESTVNIVLFLGGTIVNFREPAHSLHNIHDSMGKNDLLIFSLRLDSGRSRRYFDFTTASSTSTKGFRGKDLLDLLNIDEGHYELEQFFDAEKMARQTQVRFRVAVSIEFEYEDRKRVVSLNKDDTLLLWRATHQNALHTIQQFDENGFELLQATRSKEQESIILTSKIKHIVE